jgi:hypothetical protein
METAVRADPLLVMSALVFVASVGPSLADGRTQKYRSNGCEIERKVDDDGRFEAKVDRKPGQGRAYFGAGKEMFIPGGCEVKRERKRDGEYKEEVKCK